MILPSFTYLEPGTLDEAVRMLSQHHEEGVRVIAGGTDILVDMKHRVFPEDQRARPLQYLVSLLRIPDLYGIQITDSHVTIGAMVTMTELMEHPFILSRLRALAEGATEVGSTLVRNRGTIAGNIANARPAADTAGPVIALGGVILAQGRHGERRIPSAEFHTGPGKNTLADDEIIRAIEFPLSPAHCGSAYVKLAVRKALDISIVGVSTFVERDNNDCVAEARICLTSVGPTPILSHAAREALVGKPVSDETLEAAGSAARDDARPIDDFRGSAWYRKEMVDTLTKRLLRRSWERAHQETIR